MSRYNNHIMIIIILCGYKNCTEDMCNCFLQDSYFLPNIYLFISTCTPPIVKNKLKIKNTRVGVQIIYL